MYKYTNYHFIRLRHKANDNTILPILYWYGGMFDIDAKKRREKKKLHLSSGWPQISWISMIHHRKRPATFKYSTTDLLPIEKNTHTHTTNVAVSYWRWQIATSCVDSCVDVHVPLLRATKGCQRKRWHSTTSSHIHPQYIHVFKKMKKKSKKKNNGSMSKRLDEKNGVGLTLVHLSTGAVLSEVAYAVPFRAVDLVLKRTKKLSTCPLANGSVAYRYIYIHIYKYSVYKCFFLNYTTTKNNN